MAGVVNDRDVLLQAATVRVLPVPLDVKMEDIPGLNEAIDAASNRLEITSTTDTFAAHDAFPNLTTPTSIVLTAELKGRLSQAGAVTWSLASGSATLTPTGNTCTITGTSVVGLAVVVKAAITFEGKSYTALKSIHRYGALASNSSVNLATQVTGQLASGNITGLGALALLNSLNLSDSTKVSGALDGRTQVNHLGPFATADIIAANTIAAGTFISGVVYAGTVTASQVTAGSFEGKEFTGATFTGGVFRTATSGARVQVRASDNTFRVYNASGLETLLLDPNLGISRFRANSGAATLEVTNAGGGEALNIRSEGGYAILARSGAGHAIYAESSATDRAGVYGDGKGYAAGLIGKAVLGYGAALSSTNGFPLLLTPTSNLGAGVAGAVSMHPTHGLIFYSGSAWLKPAGGWAAI